MDRMEQWNFERVNENTDEEFIQQKIITVVKDEGVKTALYMRALDHE